MNSSTYTSEISANAFDQNPEIVFNGTHIQLNRLYSDYLPVITAFIQKRNGSRDEAADIFQDAIMVIYEKAKAGNLQLTSTFKTYLIGICKYLWMNKLRKKSRTNVSLETPSLHFANNYDGGIEADMVKHEIQALFREKIQELTPANQEFLRLCFEGKKLKEIAKEMGYASEGYAKKKKFTCKKKLMQLIEADPRYWELIDQEREFVA